MTCISVCVWDCRPSNDEKTPSTPREVFGLVHAKAHALLDDHLKYRTRIIKGVAPPAVTAVYCRPVPRMEEIAKRFWSTEDTTTKSKAEQPSKPEKPSRRPDMKNSLVGALTANLQPEQRNLAIDIFLDNFIDTPALQYWRGILWRKSNDGRDVTTTIDLAEHPIVTQLQQWLVSALEDPTHRCNPPVFPVPREFDSRPSVPLPHADFGALPDVWSSLMAVDVLRQVFQPYQSVFAAGVDMSEVQVLSQVVHDDRLRYWKQVSKDKMWFTFAEMVTIFGWQDVAKEQQIVMLITRALIATDRPSSGWWNRDAKPQTFYVERCLGPLRTAACAVAALVCGDQPASARTRMMFDLRERVKV